MPKIAVLILVLVLIFGGLFFLSTLPKQQPTHTIEVNVPRGNAWGESVSALGAKQVGNRFEFEMQSGDVIAVEAPNYSLKRTAANGLR